MYIQTRANVYTSRVRVSLSLDRSGNARFVKNKLHLLNLSEKRNDVEFHVEPGPVNRVS